MDNSKLTETIEEIVEPIVLDLGCELVDVGIVSAHRRRIVRIFIDKPGGVMVDDCAVVSRDVAAIFDVEDCISGAYSLEVSSPGIDRPLRKLRDFERFAGNEVVINTFEPIEGRRNFRGQLEKVEGESIVVTVDEHHYAIPVTAVSKAHLKGKLQTPQQKRS